MIFDIQSRLTLATMTRSDSRIDRGDWIGRYHDGLLSVLGEQKIAEDEVAGQPRALQISRDR